MLYITNCQSNANQNNNDISPHAIQNDHQKIYKQMLGVVWRKGNRLALLVGMYVDTATMKNNMEAPLKDLI